MIPVGHARGALAHSVGILRAHAHEVAIGPGQSGDSAGESRCRATAKGKASDGTRKRCSREAQT